MTSSSWKPQPSSGLWNSADNWDPTGVPAATATFSVSTQTVIGFEPTSDAKVDAIAFTEGAPAYSFAFGPAAAPALTITGDGISNGSGRLQSFIVAATSSGFRNPQLVFANTATAGGDDVFYCAGPVTEQGYGGGVICFQDKATAGSASFKVWTGAAAPPEHNTVGGEVAFCDTASADSARFLIYGSLGADGDTFGNVVFHDNATVANASFTNFGGTVSGGDGGNTQFYGSSSAAIGLFYNQGGTHQGANGGDVAFDATADAAHGRFHNYAAAAGGAYGGVTSFNNNPPRMAADQGATAGQGSYYNYGARGGEQGGGGHLTFSARYGSPTAAGADIFNYGSSIAAKSSAGHTIFSINLPSAYFPTAGDAVIWNHPAAAADGAAGYTEFAVYGEGDAGANVPTAGDATILNLGGYTANAAGGYTVFSGNTSAGNANLVAQGGIRDGYGGRIVFYGESSGGAATVQLSGDGELDLSDHSQGVAIATLDLTGGVIAVRLAADAVPLRVSAALRIHSDRTTIAFRNKDADTILFNTPYKILSCPGLSAYQADRFRGDSVQGVEPTFAIVGDSLQVTFVQP